MKKALSIIGALAIILVLQPAHATGWRTNFYNPVPAEGDIELPLPCDGAIVLRRVVTHQVPEVDSASALLMDKQIELGRASNGGERTYMESRRPDYISGSITSDDGQLSYLIGKYEVTKAQYDAVMADDPSKCPSVSSPAQALPIADISWYDAVEFTRRINNWMYSSEAQVMTMLVSLGIADGYMRLPTETEWEFAARGGLAVSDSERANTVFPMPDGFDAYVWYNGPQSANGKVRPIGTRKPNPLGIYDIYGNVAEMVLEPFRMTRGDRLHGRIGGYISKGGSFLNTAMTINSALRDEYPYFSQHTNGETHIRSIGLRVAVGTAAIDQTTDVGALEQAALMVGSQDPENRQNTETAALKLQLLAAETEDAGLRAEIERLSAELAAEFDRRNELELKGVRSALVNAALAARELAINGRTLDKYMEYLATQTDDDPMRADTLNRIESNYYNFMMFAKRYTDAIQGLAMDYPNRSGEQIPVVLRELTEQGSEPLTDFVKLVGRQVNAYTSGETTQTRDIILGVLPGEHAWLR